MRTAMHHIGDLLVDEFPELDPPTVLAVVDECFGTVRNLDFDAALTQRATDLARMRLEIRAGRPPSLRLPP